MTELTCPVCSQSSIKPVENKGGSKDYNCAVCGQFNISNSAETAIQNNSVDYRLVAWIREHHEQGRERPKITGYLLDDVIKNLPNYRPLEKQLLFLRAIERRTEYPGAEVIMNCDNDYPLAYAKNCQELEFLCNALSERKLIFLNKERLKSAGLIRFIISPEGWEYLDRQSIKPILVDRAFVAMSFNKTLENVYAHGFKTAIEKAGYKPLRVDKEPHIDRIDAKIISDIKDSYFMVADVTDQKQGVYFEAGFAIGLNRPVIWCVRQDELDKVHFDTRQYNHIVWKAPADLHEQLYNRICAVIGRRSHT